MGRGVNEENSSAGKLGGSQAVRPESMKCLPFVLFRLSPNLRAPPAPSLHRSWRAGLLALLKAARRGPGRSLVRGRAEEWTRSELRAAGGHSRGAWEHVPSPPLFPPAADASSRAPPPPRRDTRATAPYAPSSSPTRSGGLTRTQTAALRLRESLHALPKECGTWGRLPKMFVVFVLLRFTLIEVGDSQNLACISITGRGYKKALLGPVYSSGSVGPGGAPQYS